MVASSRPSINGRSKPKPVTDADFAPFTVHPAAKRVRLMNADESALLVESLRRSGLREPIPVIGLKRDRDGKPVGGTLIGGRNRFLCCPKAGVERAFRELDVEYGMEGRTLDEAEIERIAFDENVPRRHLSVDDRRQLARDYLRENPTASARSVADHAKVSEHVVADVKAEMIHTGAIPTSDTVTSRNGQQQPAKKRKGARGAHPKDKDPAPTDALGVVLPDGLRDTFRDGWYQRTLSAVAELRLKADALLTSLKEDLVRYSGPYAIYLRSKQASDFAGEAMNSLAGLHETLEHGEPYAVCPKCQGRSPLSRVKCMTCSTAGYVPKWRMAELVAQGQWPARTTES